MQTGEKIRLFQEAFRGRTAVVPRYWRSKDGAKAGYSPICSNEWKNDICKKPCRTCSNASYVPLSPTLLLKHFQGEHILGCYPLLDDNTLCFIACDMDNHTGDREPLKDVQALAEVRKVLEIPFYVARSKSGNGYHCYLFFSVPVPAWKARAVFFSLLREAQIIRDEMELSSFDKLIPDQDNLAGKKFGNLIALPFQGQAAKNGHTLFLDPGSGYEKPHPNQWGLLRILKRWTEADLDCLIEEWNLTQGETEKPKMNGSGNAAGWIAQALQGVPEGGRDDTGIKLAGYFRRKRLPDDVTTAILHLWNERNRPPLERHEIDKIVGSASRYVHEDPQNETERIGVSFGGSQGGG